jgi:hypothetical protein
MKELFISSNDDSYEDFLFFCFFSFFVFTGMFIIVAGKVGYIRSSALCE